MRALRLILVFIVTAFVFMQFFSIDKANPKVEKNADFILLENPPSQIAEMVRSACYDCHSNETVWPWYSNVAPISWVVEEHVIEGRDHLNFSYWSDFDEEDIADVSKAMIDEIQDGDMPLPGYNKIHTEANWTPEQKRELIKWLKGLQ